MTETNARSGLVWMFPGQGSQRVGMGHALVERYAVARELFQRADDVLGLRLSHLCFEGPQEQLSLTEFTQPALLTCSLAALAVVRELGCPEPIAVLGHSLGEWSALVAAGALDFADALKLVRLRGQAMQAAVEVGVGGMAAVIGLDLARVEECCTGASDAGIVAPANDNGGGQVVIAGHRTAVDRASALAKSMGAKVIVLEVSAPFHCPLMGPAADRVRDALAEVTVRMPTLPVVSNVDAELHDSVDGVRERLVRQITGRVRWEESVRKVVRMGASVAWEVGHGKTLAGLVRRIDPSIRTMAVGSPADVDMLRLAPQ